MSIPAGRRSCSTAVRPPASLHLLDAQDMAAALGVEHLWIKDERDRMGLGSFKALGAAYVIAREADTRFEGNWDRAPEAVADCPLRRHLCDR